MKYYSALSPKKGSIVGGKYIAKAGRHARPTSLKTMHPYSPSEIFPRSSLLRLVQMRKITFLFEVRETINIFNHLLEFHKTL